MALSAPHSGPTFLAIDLGASSGRGVLGTLDDGRMHMHEVHRFRTPMLERDGHLHWDIAALWHEVQLCLQRAMVLAPALRSVSVDSWGVDYVSLDAHGEPLGDTYCYRDTRTAGRLHGDRWQWSRFLELAERDRSRSHRLPSVPADRRGSGVRTDRRASSRRHDVW